MFAIKEYYDEEKNYIGSTMCFEKNEAISLAVKIKKSGSPYVCIYEIEFDEKGKVYEEFILGL